MNSFRIYLSSAVLILSFITVASGCSKNIISKKTETSGQPDTSPFSVMTFNVRHPDIDDDKAGNGWMLRRDKINLVIDEYQPDILGVQELSEKDKTSLVWFRKTRSDCENCKISYLTINGIGEEPNDIFVNPSRFTIKNSGDKNMSFYLPPYSKNPCKTALPADVISTKDYSATFAVLTDNYSKKQLAIINTHLHWGERDNSDFQIRNAQLECIKNQLNNTAPNIPAIIMGDFNTTSSSREFNNFIKSMNLENPGMEKDYDENGTWNDFCETCTPVRRIDHLVSKQLTPAGILKVISKKYDNKWPSDHCPVFGSFYL
ncbi:MAG: endonuclease/exonuclease/phosphatase family protein [Deltaproteobacteria bacterium]|nr:endonuclease/exonuclease/phosphatase family protein [Deltaproteobacteria bacterium]